MPTDTPSESVADLYPRLVAARGGRHWPRARSTSRSRSSISVGSDALTNHGALGWPVAGRITSGFGRRVHPILRFARMHKGVDFGASRGAPIHATADGQVTRAGWAGGYGRQVRIAHGGGLATSYSHMSRMVVEPGAFVRQGQLIGYVGSSGLSTGPHLHYEVRRNGRAVDPARVALLQRWLERQAPGTRLVAVTIDHELRASSAIDSRAPPAARSRTSTRGSS